MRNGWTGGQYSFVRVVLSAFLAGWFLALGTLWWIDLGPVPGWDLLREPEVIACVLGIVLTGAFSAGWHDRPAAVLLLACLVTVRWNRTWIASLPVATPEQRERFDP